MILALLVAVVHVVLVVLHVRVLRTLRAETARLTALAMLGHGHHRELAAAVTTLHTELAEAAGVVAHVRGQIDALAALATTVQTTAEKHLATSLALREHDVALERRRTRRRAKPGAPDRWDASMPATPERPDT